MAIELIFDRDMVAVNACGGNNTAEDLINRMEAKLIRLAKFAGVVKIQYFEEIKREVFILTKEDGSMLRIEACPDPDGAWLNIL